MNIVVNIPDRFAGRLADEGDLARRALEALALESYRGGRLSRPELRQLLGLGSSPALDAFLLAHGIAGTYTEADLANDREDLCRIGL